MKKRFLSVFLSLCLCLTLLPTAVMAEGSGHSSHCVCGATHSTIGDHKTETVFTEWTPVSQQSDITGTGNYYLTDDVTLNSQWKIAYGTSIVLCLNGHKLTSNNTDSGDTILIEGTLTITDCKNTGTITGTNNTSSGNHKVLVVSALYADCTLNLYGGTITGIRAGSSAAGGKGGGVHNNGTFNMYGGSIQENVAGEGGGVYNYKYSEHPGPAVFNFYGGTIESNTTAIGNAGHDVYNHGGTMNANGGTVGNSVENTGTITTTDGYAGTTFKSAITNQGTISGGQFAYNSNVENKSGASITGGTFEGPVKNKSGGTISGGTFKAEVKNNGTISGGTFTTVENFDSGEEEDYGARITFKSEDEYQNFMARNRSASITGPGYILVTLSYYIPYSYRGTELNGAHTKVTWSNLTDTGAGITAGCAWNGDSKTLTLTNVYINKLDLTDYGAADDITIVIDGDVTINQLSLPTGHTGTITVQGKTGRDTDTLYSYTDIAINTGAFLFKNLTAQLESFNADNSTNSVTLDNASVTCNGNFDLNQDNQKDAKAYRTLALTNSSLTMQCGDSRPILYAERMTMDEDSTLTLDQAYIQAKGLVENGLDGLKNFLPDGYSIKRVDDDLTTIVDTEENLVAKLTLKYTVKSASDDSDPTYAIRIEDAEHGSVALSVRRKYAWAGDTVTLLVDPDRGWTLETLTVTDSRGSSVDVTAKNGKYTFKMPASKVTVTATFMEDNSMLSFFVDVPVESYYYDAVLWAAENGITGGVDETHFGPDRSCTRAQAVTFLYRAAQALGLDVSVGEDTNILSYNDAFDVPEYAVSAFQWAVGMGIVQGNNGDLDPNASCTRAQIVTFLHRFAVSAGLDVSVGEDTNILSYNDAFDVPEYAVSAFQWAVGAGIVQGNNGDLDPNASCTRAQIVTFLFRQLGD